MMPSHKLFNQVCLLIAKVVEPPTAPLKKVNKNII